MSCEKATYLMDKATLTKLSVGERFRLRTHLVICRWCKRYQDDAKILVRLLKKVADKTEPGLLTKEEKSKMAEQLRLDSSK